MAKQLPKQLEVVVSFAKNNTLAVVFTALVVIVPLGGYFAADMMGEGVRKEAQRRAQVYSDITSASNAKATLPVPGSEPVELDVVATDQVVTQFSAALEKYSKDALDVYERARVFNGGSDSKPKHAPAVDAGVFPGYDSKSNTVVEQVRFKVASADASAPAEGAVVDAGAAPAMHTEPVIDPKQEAKRDFTGRFTGRVSNGVYDVRLADVTFVAETS